MIQIKSILILCKSVHYLFHIVILFLSFFVFLLFSKVQGMELRALHFRPVRQNRFRRWKPSSWWCGLCFLLCPRALWKPHFKCLMCLHCTVFNVFIPFASMTQGLTREKASRVIASFVFTHLCKMSLPKWSGSHQRGDSWVCAVCGE